MERVRFLILACRHEGGVHGFARKARFDRACRHEGGVHGFARKACLHRACRHEGQSSGSSSEADFRKRQSHVR